MGMYRFCFFGERRALHCQAQRNGLVCGYLANLEIRHLLWHIPKAGYPSKFLNGLLKLKQITDPQTYPPTVALFLNPGIVLLIFAHFISLTFK